MNAMINDVVRNRKIPGISVPNRLFNMGLGGNEWQGNTDYLPLFSRDLLYYGFRNLPPMFRDPAADIGSMRFVLLVRDPRDALVSEYFSFGTKAGSHVAPKNNPQAFLARKAATDDIGIDDYVLKSAANLNRKLADYRDNMNFDLGLLRRYEQVFFDKQTFLAEIFDHFGIEVPEKVIATVAARHDIRPEQEDPTKHIRKGLPGDHQEKLRPETIARLNDIFRDVGAFYGYSL